MVHIAELPGTILEQIKSNELTPPNALKIVGELPRSITRINDDLTLRTRAMLCTYLDMMIVIIYIDIDEDPITGEYRGSQAIDAFIIE